MPEIGTQFYYPDIRNTVVFSGSEIDMGEEKKKWTFI